MKGKKLHLFWTGGGYQQGFMKGIPFELDSDYELDLKVKNILSQKKK